MLRKRASTYLDLKTLAEVDKAAEYNLLTRAAWIRDACRKELFMERERKRLRDLGRL